MSQFSPPRHLPWDGITNARDLGGYPAADGITTRYGAFVRTDDLCRLTDTGRQQLLDYGIRTVIDLRTPHEWARDPHPFADNQYSVMYHPLSLMNMEDLEGLAQLDTITRNGEMYTIFFDRFGAQIAQIIRTLAAAPDGGVLFHCFAGKDRTGVIAALLLENAGVTREIIALDYAETRHYNSAINSAWAQSVAHDPVETARITPLLDAPAAAMLEGLTYLDEAHGGVERYLLHHGVSREDLDQLRVRLREA